MFLSNFCLSARTKVPGGGVFVAPCLSLRLQVIFISAIMITILSVTICFIRTFSTSSYRIHLLFILFHWILLSNRSNGRAGEDFGRDSVNSQGGQIREWKMLTRPKHCECNVDKTKILCWLLDRWPLAWERWAWLWAPAASLDRSTLILIWFFPESALISSIIVRVHFSKWLPTLWSLDLGFTVRQALQACPFPMQG